MVGSESDRANEANEANEVGHGPAPVPPIPATTVDVWLAEPPAEHDQVLADDDLSDEERAAAARLHREADRLAYTTAHLLRRRVVADRTDCAPAEVAFGHEPCPVCAAPDHGRPVVVGGGVEVSLSRTAGLVGVALSPAVVGLDVEAVDRPVTLEDLVPALHPAERRVGLDRAGALRLWVRKEAFLKGLGTGLGRDPATVDVLDDPPGWRIVEVDAGPGHLAAVAVRTTADDTVAVDVRRVVVRAPARPGPTGR